MKLPNHMVMFFDEGRFGLKAETGRYWALKGERAKKQVNTRYTNFYIYTGVSPGTGEAYSLFMPWVNTKIMNMYLKELSETYSDRKMLIIMDRAGWHRSRELEKPDNIEIEYLPPYSPELNPVEKVWQWMRRHVCRNQRYKSEEELMTRLEEELLSLKGEKNKKLCNCSYMPLLK